MIESKKRNRSDIYGIPLLKTVFKNPRFILGVRLIVLALFIYGVYLGFTDNTTENTFTRNLFWGLFWSLFIVVTLASMGRIFCGICPHAFLGKYITRRGLKKKMPKWMQNPFIGLFLLFFGWWAVYYIAPGFYKTPLATAVFFTVLTLLAFITYYVYKDMSYCKSICPIGGLMQAFGRIAPTWLSTYKEDCQSCKTFECASACHYNLKPFSFDGKASMGDCTLCMDCATSCEAVRFKFTKPSFSLFKKFNTKKIEVWAFILITAAIPITMNFHHALNRSALADSMIWTQTAAYFERFIDFGTLDSVGLFAFIYATLFSIAIVYAGMFAAAKLLDAEFKKTFYTLGYAFAPLFIIGGLSHLLHSFFTHTYADIANGFIYGFGLDVDTVHNLATRKDAWLAVFNLIPYIAVIWGVLILGKRLSFFDASRLKKALAFIFASSLITFYLGLNIYKIYVFKTYGMKQRHHHAASVQTHHGDQHKGMRQ